MNLIKVVKENCTLRPLRTQVSIEIRKAKLAFYDEKVRPNIVYARSRGGNKLRKLLERKKTWCHYWVQRQALLWMILS